MCTWSAGSTEPGSTSQEQQDTSNERDMAGFEYDEGSGMYYNTNLGCYFDASQQLYGDASSGQWFSFEGGSYKAVSTWQDLLQGGS